MAAVWPPPPSQSARQRSTTAMNEAVEKIMLTYRSLPARPTLDDVNAAEAVFRASEAEEEARTKDLERMAKNPDLPDELFAVLKDVLRIATRLRAEDQRREARRVLDLDRRFRDLDELVQRASRLVSPDSADEDSENRSRLPPAEVKLESRARISDLSLEKASSCEAPKALTRSSSWKLDRAPAPVFADGGSQKISLIKLAGLIESSAKNETKALDLQSKLMDQVEWLPLSLGKLTAITDLNLSENQLLALPSNIGDLKSLKKLDLHSNKLINLPESIGELTQLTDLDLKANNLKSLPATLGNLASLATLDLSSNQLSVLPDTLGNLTSLRKLNAETNELEELPYTIGSCSALEDLRLDFNQIRGMPEAMGKLESLQVLSLHYNRIKGLPTTMASLQELRELDVSFNELESIPESLCFATKLVKLRVGNNFADLRALPRSIGNLEMLEELDISNDQIKVLPSSFRLLSKLRVFLADGTPLEVPPREVVDLGAQAAVKYMADLEERKNAPVEAEKKKGLCSCLFSIRSPH
ncbi:plant intracellular Ras-group-related LRR protein 5-like [Wolffia australiana]